MKQIFKKPFKFVKKEAKHRINNFILAEEVRIVGDEIKSDIYPLEKAKQIAISIGLDLIEINSKAVPIICLIADYQKFLYKEKQKDKDMKKKQEQSELKELRFTPTTDEHDFQFKTNHAIHWLKAGDKVKAVVVFKGRMIKYKESGEILLLKLAEALNDYGKVEQLPKLEGFKMSLIIIPKKKS